MSFRAVPINETKLSSQKKKDLSNFKFPKSFNKEIDYSILNKQIISRYINKKINELLPDDEILIDFIINLVFEEHTAPKELCIQLMSFLNDDTMQFVEELWNLLISAQNDIHGIPIELIKEREEVLKLEDLRDQEYNNIGNKKQEGPLPLGPKSRNYQQSGDSTPASRKSSEPPTSGSVSPNVDYNRGYNDKWKSRFANREQRYDRGKDSHFNHSDRSRYYRVRDRSDRSDTGERNRAETYIGDKIPESRSSAREKNHRSSNRERSQTPPRRSIKERLHAPIRQSTRERSKTPHRRSSPNAEK